MVFTPCGRRQEAAPLCAAPMTHETFAAAMEALRNPLPLFGDPSMKHEVRVRECRFVGAQRSAPPPCPSRCRLTLNFCVR